MRATTELLGKDMKAAGGILDSFAKSESVLSGRGRIKEGLDQIASGAQRALGAIKFDGARQEFSKLGLAARAAFQDVLEAPRVARTLTVLSTAAAGLASPFLLIGKSARSGFGSVEASARAAFGAVQSNPKVVAAVAAIGAAAVATSGSMQLLGQSAVAAMSGLVSRLTAVVARIPGVRMLGPVFAGVKNTVGAAFASVKEFGGGLGQIGAGLGKLGAGAGKVGLGVLAAGAKVAVSGLKTLGSFLGALVTKFAMIGAVIGGVAVAALASWTAEGLKAVDSTGDLAARIGTSTESLTSLRYATQLTGSEAEVLDGALQKMNALLGDATTKGGPTADALKRLGLSAQELAQLDPAEAFRRIVAGFQKIPNQAERAALAMDLFGKAGINLVNTLSAGPEELARLEAEAQKLGITFSAIDASKVGAANDALDRIGGVFQGIKNQLAIQLAPLITDLGQRFVEWATQGEGAAGRVSGALEQTASVMGFVADSAQTIGAVFAYARGVATDAIRGIVQLLGLIPKAINAVSGLIPGMATSFGQTLDIMAEDLDRLERSQFGKAQELWDATPASDKVKKFFADARQGADATAAATANATNANRGLSESYVDLTAKIRDLEKSLSGQVKSFGQSGHQAEVNKLLQEGASESDLKKARALANQLDALDKAKKKEDDLKAKAKSVFEESLTPLEKYNKQLMELNELLQSGAISQETFNRAKTKAGKELADAQKKSTEKSGPALLSLGSEELRSAQLRINGPKNQDPIKDVAATAKEQVSLTQKGLQYLAAIAQNGKPNANPLNALPIGN